MDYSVSSVKPWRQGFPKLFAHTSISKMKCHPDYQAAKSGDVRAAERLVSDVVKPERVKELASQFPQAIVVPVVEQEADGRNAIPRALATHIADIGDLKMDNDITQISTVRRTKLNAIQRLLSRKEFAGRILSGGQYILVDDVATQGGTLHELRHYLVNNGADAVAASSLAFSRGGNILAIQDETIKRLEDFGRDELETLLQEHNICGTIEALTEGEARSLLRFKTLDSLRARIAEEMEQGYSAVSDEKKRERTSAPVSRLKEPSAPYGKVASVAPLFEEKPFHPLTQKDLQHAFPYASQIVSDGDNHVVSVGNFSFLVRSVHRITPDETDFALSYGREFDSAKDSIDGQIFHDEIRIACTGSVNTIRHESWHLVENLGLVTDKEKAVLDKAAAHFFSPTSEQYTLSMQEKRARFVEHNLTHREFVRQTPVGRVLQKLADFVDGLVNLCHRTANGIVKDMEQGHFFEREATPKTKPAPRMRMRM